jgi:hypothetical protein
MLLHPEPDQVVNFTRGGEKRMYNVWDVKKHTKSGKIFNLQGSYNAKVKYGEITPPPLYAHRFVTGWFVV